MRWSTLTGTVVVGACVVACSMRDPPLPPLHAGSESTLPVVVRLTRVEETGTNTNKPWILVDAALTNIGSKPLSLFAVGDGSDVGWRPSRVEWLIDGEVDDSRSVGRCGNRNAMDRSDLITLQPGETTTMRLAAFSPKFTEVLGPREITLVLSHVSAARLHGIEMGDDDDDVLDAIDDIASYRIVSEPLRLEFGSAQR
ncbi:MAG: hypothetical protein IPH13_15445 [Planctomycetes bacterium]|nr:hypothetical protein [Planctomycetota bacterium]MCC7168968.1 hypothetical protein [Planctomycetota bacterium]